MTGKRERASYDWSGKWREISQPITMPSNLKKITISKKNRVAGCQWRENGCEQAMIGRENGARFLSKSQGPSTLKKNHNLKEKSCSGCQWRENGCEQDFKLLLLLASYDWSGK